jgi:hypothetical protein
MGASSRGRSAEERREDGDVRLPPDGLELSLDALGFLRPVLLDEALVEAIQ